MQLPPERGLALGNYLTPYWIVMGKTLQKGAYNEVAQKGPKGNLEEEEVHHTHKLLELPQAYTKPMSSFSAQRCLTILFPIQIHVTFSHFSTSVYHISCEPYFYVSIETWKIKKESTEITK